jgi:hypothetical protein
MAKLKVHIVNFDLLHGHIEIWLENLEPRNKSYFVINRWRNPGTWFDSESIINYRLFNFILEISLDKKYSASQLYTISYWQDNDKNPTSFQKLGSLPPFISVYSFEIDANPQEIQREWHQYYYATIDKAHILGNNCAVAAQWFLSKYANIPAPSFSYTSGNHLALGIIWPSLLPCPVTLPGRVMSNAQFYIEARKHPEIANRYSYLFWYMCLSMTVLLCATSILGIIAASTILSGGLAPLVMGASALMVAASVNAFFKICNRIEAKNIANAHLQNPQEEKLLLLRHQH